MSARACGTCAAPLPPAHARYCSARCRKRSRNRRNNRRKAFLRNAKRPVAIEIVAERFNISVEEAARRAEHDIAAGRLIGWRHRDGRLVEISTPVDSPPGDGGRR